MMTRNEVLQYFERNNWTKVGCARIASHGPIAKFSREERRDGSGRYARVSVLSAVVTRDALQVSHTVEANEKLFEVTDGFTKFDRLEEISGDLCVVSKITLIIESANR